MKKWGDYGWHMWERIMMDCVVLMGPFYRKWTVKLGAFEAVLVEVKALFICGFNIWKFVGRKVGFYTVLPFLFTPFVRVSMQVNGEDPVESKHKNLRAFSKLVIYQTLYYIRP